MSLGDGEVAALEANLQRHAVAAGVQSLSTSRPSRLSARDCATHIRILHETAQLLSEVLVAQVMECCWRIWESCEPDEAERIVRDETPLTVAKSRAYAAGWAAARNNRAVLDVASRRPNLVLRLVADVADTLDVQAGDDEVGRAVAELVALPARQRTEALRRLVAESKDARRSGADIQRIEDLEHDNAALREAHADRSNPASIWRDIHGRAGDVADQLESIAEAVSGLGTVPDRHRDRLLRALDTIMGTAEAVSARVSSS